MSKRRKSASTCMLNREDLDVVLVEEVTTIADTNQLGSTQMKVVIIVMVGNATTQMNAVGSIILRKQRRVTL